MANIFSANRSSIMIDGQAIDGVRSLTYRVATEREDIGAVGSNERIGTIFGLRTVQAELTVSSANFVLDQHLSDSTTFQLVARLSREAASDDSPRVLSFDGCYVDGKSFSMSAGGSALSIYSLSATRVREE